MKDAPNTTPPSDTDQATARPNWRFTGRRGTPVHLRERTPSTLPPEIRSTVTQMARERAGEATPPSGTPPTRAASGGLRMSTGTASQPPVAGAPLPVERRSRSERAQAPVATTSLDAVPAPVASAVPTKFALPVAEAVATPAAPPEPSTPAEPALQPASAPSTATPNTAARPLTPAQKKHRAKQRAKQRAKLAKTRQAKPQPQPADPTASPTAEASTPAPTKRIRKLFARDRADTAPPAASTTAGVPASEAPAAIPTTAVPTTPAAVRPPAARLDAGPDVEVPDLPSELPVLDAVWSPTVSAQPMQAADAADETPPPATSAAPTSPGPVAGLDSASQSAWEIGRAPILTDDLRGAAPAAPADDPLMAVLPAMSPPRRRTPERRPAPITPPIVQTAPSHWTTAANDVPEIVPPRIDTPRRPATIARLQDPLFAPRTADDATPDERRRRIADRRRDLNDLVASLSSMGSDPL